MLNFKQMQFITSAAKMRQLPADEGIEVAIVGRSNAGKSSALNTLANQKQLARTSKTPGRTQLINVFEITPETRLIDLPGYGFAKVPLAVKEQWQNSLAQYLEERTSLQGLIVVMDCRHPLKDTDQHIIEWATRADLPVHILLTKADKLKFGPAKQALLGVQKALALYGDRVTSQLFSATSKQGLEEFESLLLQWYLAEDK